MVMERKILAMQAERIRADRAAEEKALRHEQSLADIEGLRQIKQQKAADAEYEQELLSKEREIAGQAAKARDDRESAQRALLQEQRNASIEGLRQIKQQKAADVEYEKELLAKEREMAVQVAQSNFDRKSAEKSLLQQQRNADIEGLRQIKQRQRYELELQRENRAKEEAIQMAAVAY